MIERSIKAGRPTSHRAEWEAELHGIPLPAAAAYLWRTFNRLRRRVSNGMAACPISLGDVADFMRLFQYPLAPWEIEVIEELDDLFLATHAKASRDQTSKGDK